MSRFRTQKFFAAAGLFGLLACATLAQAARIDADPSKKYTLTPDHGPWMIMVASFQSTSNDGVTKHGKSPEEAAHELVIELRRKGIPAYMHGVNLAAGEVHTRDRYGRQVVRRNQRQSPSIGVLAGNYESIDDANRQGNIAQKTLKWIKSYSPECLQKGVVFQKTKTRPTPLAGAFLTINPMISPEEIEAHRSVDNFVLRLNHGERNSLLDNPGKLTLIVASFAGKSGIDTPLAGFGGSGQSFVTDDDLDIAAEEARDLAATMRQVEGIEAFVWHDRYRSIVTVGSFSSANDPAIEGLKARFGAKQKLNSLVTSFNNSVQVLAVDANGRKIPFDNSLGGLATGGTSLPEGFRIWAYDPNPQIMSVPRRR